MALSALFAVLPLFGLVVANILSKALGCPVVTEASIPDCPL